MIRAATAADCDSIAALMNHWILNTAVTFNPIARSPAEVAGMIASKSAAGHGFFVATDSAGRVIGQASYGQFRVGVGYRTCMEHSINLLPDERGRGTGRALMTVIEDHARAGGAHQMIGGISGENPGGRAFHESLGYRVIATVPEAGFKFGRFIDLVLMQKFL